MSESRHWVRWHEAYGDPNSSLSRRLAVVQRRLGHVLDEAPKGNLQLISICAGRGLDVLTVLSAHPRRDDVSARLVELDPVLANDARTSATTLGLRRVEVVNADAATTSAYVGAVPADVVMACGIFGNISNEDVHHTVLTLPSLLAPRGVVIWTRHRNAPDLTPAVREWFAECGFVEMGFDSEEGRSFAVGTHRLHANPSQFHPDVTMFAFVGDGSGAST